MSLQGRQCSDIYSKICSEHHYKTVSIVADISSDFHYISTDVHDFVFTLRDLQLLYF